MTKIEMASFTSPFCWPFWGWGGLIFQGRNSRFFGRRSSLHSPTLVTAVPDPAPEPCCLTPTLPLLCRTPSFSVLCKMPLGLRLLREGKDGSPTFPFRSTDFISSPSRSPLVCDLGGFPNPFNSCLCPSILCCWFEMPRLFSTSHWHSHPPPQKMGHRPSAASGTFH